MKKTVITLLALGLILTSSLAFAGEVDEMTILGDVFILRPLGLVATAVGGVCYLVSLPIAAITDSTDEVYETLLESPYEFTFKRPVGDIGSGL